MSVLPDWREVAKQSVEHTRRFVEFWNRYERENRERAREVLLEHMDYEDAVIAAPHLFGWTQGRGGREAAQAKQAEVERKVLERLARLGSNLPPARNLIATLTMTPGLRRDSTRDALRRLARAGRLPDQYLAHFLSD